jgi:hypothetical protein
MCRKLQGQDTGACHNKAFSLTTFREFLLAIHRRPRWGWIGLVLYAAAVTFPHEQVQYIVNEIANWMSHKRLYQLSAAILLLQGALLTFFVSKRIAGQPARRMLATFWILTIALIWCTWRFFTANNVELVHYPQYVPEGMALLALTLSPAESLAWIALFGGLDECFQYWDLMGAKKVPFDFNDVYMDLLGGAAGVVLAMVILRCDRRTIKASWKNILLRPGVVMILSLVAIGIVLWSCGLMVLYDDANAGHWFALSRVRMPTFWFQVIANGPNKYHTLSPIEGPILILATIALYATLDRRCGAGSHAGKPAL